MRRRKVFYVCEHTVARKADPVVERRVLAMLVEAGCRDDGIEHEVFRLGRGCYRHVWRGRAPA